MLLSHPHKFIYIKAAKVGGTSTEVYLQNACTNEPIEVRKSSKTDLIIDDKGIVGARSGLKGKAESPRFHGHMHAQAVKNQLDPEIFSSYTKIANVRNPFTLHLSRFLQRLHGTPQGMPEKFEDMRAAFLADEKMDYAMNSKAHYFADGEMVIDRGIAFERLEEDVLSFAKDVGYDYAPNKFPTLKVRKSARDGNQTKDTYDQAMIDRVLEMYDWYFDAFGYSRDISKADEPPAPKK